MAQMIKTAGGLVPIEFKIKTLTGLVGVALHGKSATGIVAYSGAFNPSALFSSGENGVWYDPSDLSTMWQDSAGTTPVTAVGQPVGKITDKSGRGNHATQSTSGKRPLLQQDAGGRYYLAFNGTSSVLSTAAALNLSATDKASVFLALLKNTDATVAVALELGSDVNANTGSFAVLAPSTNATTDYGLLVHGSTVVAGYLTTGFPAGTPNVVTLGIDIAGADRATECFPRVDGFVPTLATVGAASCGSGNLGNYTLNIGSRAGTGILFAGRVYGLVVRGAATSQIDTDRVEAYLCTKCGVSVPAKFTPTNFSDTGAAAYSSDHYITSQFASVDLQTTATIIDVTFVNDVFNIYPFLSNIGVYVDGIYNSSLASIAEGVTTRRIALAPGSKIVSLVNSGQSRPVPGAPPIGAFIQTLRANAAVTQVHLSPVNRLLVYGDSISCGGNATTVMSDAWAVKVRAASYPNSVAFEGWGYRSLWDDASDSTKRAAFVANLVAYAPVKIWLAIGTNDYGLNKWSAAAFGAAYAALLDGLHAALPSATIYCQSPILRSTETANGSGSTMGNYRTQISTAASARSGYCTFVDGTAFMTTGSLADGVHPTSAGHALYATAVQTVLGL